MRWMFVFGSGRGLLGQLDATAPHRTLYRLSFHHISFACDGMIAVI